METEGELLVLEREWARALQTGDTDFLESLLASEYRLSFVSDPRAPRTVGREEWFAMASRMSLGSVEFLGSHETLLGNVGIMQVACRFLEWRLDGNLLPSDYTVTDVFIKRDGRWQVVNRISEPAGDAPEFWK